MSNLVTCPIIERIRVVKNEPSISVFTLEKDLENEETLNNPVGEIDLFACSYCAVDFPDRNALERHITEIHKGLNINGSMKRVIVDNEELSISDYEAEEMFENEEDIDDPVSEDGRFACSHCVADFPDKSALERHITEIHKGVKIHGYTEITVIKDEPSVSDYEAEEMLENEEDIGDTVSENDRFACSHCVADFPDKSALERHITEIHKGVKIHGYTERVTVIKDGLSVPDYEAEEMFVNEEDVDYTISASGQFACSHCVAYFPDRKALERHIRIVHKGLQIYVCEYCKKEFFYKSHFDIHLRFHRGEKPYTCKICLKSCVTSFNLANHMISHNKERRFECYVCGMKFYRKNALKNHTRLHTGEKRFTCPICQKEFLHSNSFKYHVSTHQTEDFVCDSCGKTFSEKYRYDYHLRTHDPRYNKNLCE